MVYYEGEEGGHRVDALSGNQTLQPLNLLYGFPNKWSFLPRLWL